LRGDEGCGPGLLDLADVRTAVALGIERALQPAFAGGHGVEHGASLCGQAQIYPLALAGDVGGLPVQLAVEALLDRGPPDRMTMRFRPRLRQGPLGKRRLALDEAVRHGTVHRQPAYAFVAKDHVAQLMREHRPAGGGGRTWSPVLKGDVWPEGKGAGTEAARRQAGCRVVVEPHLAEVRSEARLEERQASPIERPPGTQPRP